MERTHTVKIARVDKHGVSERKETVVKETPLTVLLNGVRVSTLMCTPYAPENLGVGFLLSEDLIHDDTVITDVHVNENEEITVDIITREPITLPERYSYERILFSGGGITMSSSNKQGHVSRPGSGKLTYSWIVKNMKDFQERSDLFTETGGVHSAGLFIKKSMEFFADDIGRHNAVDRVFGECKLKGSEITPNILFSSGRISTEILMKGAGRGIEFVVSCSACTDMAVMLAQELNITLIGFVREERMNVYSCRSFIDPE